ncbi:MAG TPA: hypothetical protein VFJ18_07245 [Pararhizobium sp.]|nr:hypothetical protein [Pararhizobium sp.]
MADSDTDSDSEEKPKRFRLPRKMVFIAAGAGLLLATASAAAAYFIGGSFNRDSPVYGLACNLVDSVSFRQDGERWVRKYISVENSDGISRVRTAVRVARHVAKADHADLVLVVVLDRNGPHQRALMRDNAVGATLVYAPHPARVRAVSAAFSARYTKAEATDAGYFYGDATSLPLTELDAMAAAMTAPYGCREPKVEKAEKAPASHADAKTPASVE